MSSEATSSSAVANPRAMPSARAAAAAPGVEADAGQPGSRESR